MKIKYTLHGEDSVLEIRTCILRLLKHARVVDAAMNAVPEATVYSSGVFCLKTTIRGKAERMNEARMAARAEEAR